MMRALCLVLSLLLPGWASAQGEIQGEGYIVKVWLDPPKVATGERMQLNVLVGVDSYFSGPLRIVTPSVRQALVLDQAQGVSGIHDYEGTRYASLLQQIDIFPSREGVLMVPPFSVHFARADLSGGGFSSKAESVTTQSLLALVQTPPAMGDLDAFMVSPQVSVTDEWDVEEGQTAFVVGDVIQRVISTTAANMASMNMPEVGFQVPRGVSMTLAEPELSSSNYRGEQTATITQRVNYAIESPGQYTLGGETLSWWDPESAERVDHQFAVQTLDAGGLPWKLIAVGALGVCLAMILVVLIWRWLKARDPQEVAINRGIRSPQPAVRLSSLYAFADRHCAVEAEPARLRALLSDSPLPPEVLSARYSDSGASLDLPTRQQARRILRRLKQLQRA